MKNKILTIFFLLFFFLNPAKTLAQESIQNFDTNLTAHKNGSLSIEEKINYDFGNNLQHGIYRTIPLVSKVGNLYRVIDINILNVLRDGEREYYSTEKNNNSLNIKIGNANKRINGAHIYTIDYTVSNAIGSNYTDHDEIYWNATGNEWRVPINSATATIQTDFGTLPGNTICFTGGLGSTNNNCSVEQTPEGKKIAILTPLLANEGLTFVSSFPVNTFPKSILQRQTPEEINSDRILMFLIGLYLFLNLILAPLLLYWYIKHKRKKRFGPPVVNFDIPKTPKGERILPAESGTIDNTKLDKDDLTATIFDLAIRKYLRIEQVDKKRLIPGIGNKYDYKLIKLKSFDSLTAFEKDFISKIFASKENTLLSEVKMDYEDYTDLKKLSFNSLIKKGFYTKNPETQMGILLGMGIFLTISMSIPLGLMLIFLSRKLNGRTALGDETDWKIDGLKLFLKNMSRNYKWQADKAYTVEQMIPYAVALGYIDEFMKQLKILNPDYNPDWYIGQGMFYAMYPGFNTSFSNNITTVAPQSSSGFSGGSSGGGGGGGGGGSW